MQLISYLTRPNAEWTWNKAFEEIKHFLTSAPVLAYINLCKELSMQYDTSGQGKETVLLQEGKPLAYASRSRALSDTETRFATIEKEMLVIVFSVEKWHQQTYGRHVTVY